MAWGASMCWPWCKIKSFVSYVRIPCQDKILLYLDIMYLVCRWGCICWWKDDSDQGLQLFIKWWEGDDQSQGNYSFRSRAYSMAYWQAGKHQAGGEKVFEYIFFFKNVCSNISDNAYWQAGKHQAGGEKGLWNIYFLKKGLWNIYFFFKCLLKYIR